MITFSLSAAGSSDLNPDAAKPPAAERRAKIVGLHGDKVEDPYFWLRERENPAVLAHLKTENAYTEAVLAPFRKFESALYEEMLGRIKQSDVTAPYLQRGYWLYTRTEEGKQYPIFCRKKGALDTPEEVVLDLNALAKGQKFMAVRSFAYSDDNTLLAYTVDVSGHRDFDFHLKNLLTGGEIQTPIGKVVDLVWAADNKTLFFVTEDAAKRSNRLWRHTLGENEATLIYDEKDEPFSLGVDRSRDGKFIFAGSVSSRTTEFRFSPRGSAAGRVARDHAAPERNQVFPRASRRHLLHSHERGRERVSRRHGTGRHA